MGNTASKKMTVANASIYDIYVKVVPQRSSSKLVKLECKRYLKTQAESMEAYIEESIMVDIDTDSFTLINPCNSCKFSDLVASNYLSVVAVDENGGRSKICSEMKVNTKTNQIFAYTMMKKSRKGKIWIDSEHNNYENHFKRINEYLKVAILYRKDLDKQIARSKQDLEKTLLSKREQDKKMLKNFITLLELHSDCFSCKVMKQKAESTTQWKEIEEAIKTNGNVCRHWEDMNIWTQKTIYKRKTQLEEKLANIKSNISQLQNTKKLDDKALKSESNFQQFKDKQRTKLNIRILRNSK